jgi:predicted acetyltransferase
MPASLIALSIHNKDQFEDFLSDFDSNPSELHGYFYPRDWLIDKIVDSLDQLSRGEGLKEGWVPCTTRFWVKDDIIQGVINIRHHLTPSLRESGGHIGYSVAPSQRRQGVAVSMLTAALPFCKQIGITKALLTCNAYNIGSIKTIEKAGGVLEREDWSKSEHRDQRWYWINLD